MTTEEKAKVAKSLGLTVFWKNSPHIWTISRVIEEFGGSDSQVRKRLMEATETGEWVKGVVRINGRPHTAYVMKGTKVEFE